jgi:peroxiredoxin Q/BCP
VHEAYGVLAVREADGERVEKVRRSTFVIGPDRRVRQAWHDVSVDGHALDVLGAAAPGR